jgi:hypothetical protein
MAGMSDTAQKRDVLEALRSLLAHRTEDLGCYEFVLEAWIESAADEIERLRAARRWIPVSEPLPEMDERVMVGNAADGWVTVGSRHLTGQYHHWDGDDSEELHEPTHWMPLPEPPTQ